ncbi:MAG TPA: PQQ-dependent sugar dehydrogenase [Terriglobales bacterium]|jgi:glucose/arabinose dehydrogenase|nr:PQQ-dependent sugar dehydrogenase [Terriglobales bacterium]
MIVRPNCSCELLLKVFVPILALGAGLAPLQLTAQDAAFHNAPASAIAEKNPYAGQAAAVDAGKAVYSSTCITCHGPAGQGTGNVPPLVKGAAQSASDGEVFWYITKGDIENGMPSWKSLPEEQRWQVVTYIKSLSSGSSAPSASAPAVAPQSAPAVSNAPPPTPPFTDYRYESPGTVRHITIKDLPQPFATQSATNGPKVVARPENAWPKTLPGFKVNLFASGLTNPRIMRIAPNGDIFLAETSAGDIKVFRGMTSDGKPEQVKVFATGLNTPFGIAFYPLGKNPEWVYVSNMDSVVRFPYHNGDMTSSGPPQHLLDLPSGGHHRSRDIVFSPDGKKMFVSVGSDQNVDDAPTEKNRADILELNPDGSGLRVYASGIRNPVGIAISPTTGELWCSVNERDGLGNNLVPDYITHVQDGGFYGWPWWYMGRNQDPRMAGKHPELKDKVITPDVILQPHNASLEMTFYDGKQFPAEYAGDIFAAEHGSWNRSPRAGYEVIRVPLHQTGHATGEYEDFLTGFVVDDQSVWGRPVGVAVAPDGSLLVSDDASGSIWRVSYSGK